VFLSGRCDAYTTGSSRFAGFRFMQVAKAPELTILPEPIGWDRAAQGCGRAMTSGSTS
jgi:hypothetical protein